MCGRARCTLTAHQVAQACGLNPQDASSVPTHQIDRYRPTYNVSPGTYLPVFRVRRSPSEGGDTRAAAAGPVVHCMKWGLIPSFTMKTEKPDHYRMFNARSESIKEKASFRRLIPNNRCLVAVEGFYEWKKDGSKKQPYYIHFKGYQPLVFAALYDFWENSEGEVLHTFTILTTQSSSALEWLHDRMPVILRDNGSINLWLNDPSARLETILGPCEDPDLVWYPVTSAMGKPSFDGPECIKEIQLKPAGEKPITMFFAKRTEVKSQPEILKSSKQEDNLDNVKEEPGAEETEEKITEEERNDHIESENCGIKREFEETETASRLMHENKHTKHISPAPKKGKYKKNSGDKQASLLSYFGKW